MARMTAETTQTRRTAGGSLTGGMVALKYEGCLYCLTPLHLRCAEAGQMQCARSRLCVATAWVCDGDLGKCLG